MSNLQDMSKEALIEIIEDLVNQNMTKFDDIINLRNTAKAYKEALDNSGVDYSKTQELVKLYTKRLSNNIN